MRWSARTPAVKVQQCCHGRVSQLFAPLVDAVTSVSLGIKMSDQPKGAKLSRFTCLKRPRKNFHGWVGPWLCSILSGLDSVGASEQTTCEICSDRCAVPPCQGILHDYLASFVQTTLPKAKPGKKSKFVLGVSDPKIGNGIQENLGITCVCDDISNELLRGVRLHIASFIDGLEDTDLDRAQLGLAHAYSRSRVKFDVNRADKHIIQSIAILDQMDKDLNTFAMRVREWYSWHFPEMVKVTTHSI